MSNPIDREVAVFSAVRRLPAGERGSYLDETCAGDAALPQRIQELRRASEEAGPFLHVPARGAQRPADALTSPDTVFRTLWRLGKMPPTGQMATARVPHTAPLLADE